MLSEEIVKNYFRREGTVVKWWNPTKDDYAYLFSHQVDMIKKWLENANIKNCLEVSCGKGRVTKELSSFFEDYIATDISDEMLSIAQQNCQNATYRNEDAENLSIESESKDCVICLEALVHYPNPQKAIKEFYRVLKPGGALILDADNKYSLRRLVKKAYQFAEGNKKQFGQDIFTPYSKKEFVSMLTSPGFHIEIFKYVGTVSPVTVHTKQGKTCALLSSNISKQIHNLNLDNVPLINKLATYYLVLARK